MDTLEKPWTCGASRGSPNLLHPVRWPDAAVSNKRRKLRTRLVPQKRGYRRMSHLRTHLVPQKRGDHRISNTRAGWPRAF